MDKGKLIVIDGIDGSGKTTQIELLGKYLTEKSIPYEVINFPRYGQNLYADLVTRYLEGEFGNINEVNPYLMACIFAGDRLLAKSLIENWLAEGKIVIANRYVSSSKAHLGANLPEEGRENFMGWIDELEYQTNGMPKPNLNILLKVTPEIGQQNALKDQKTDIHEKSLKHEQKASEIYLDLSKTEENWVVVDCMENETMKSEEAINKEIIQILSSNRL